MALLSSHSPLLLFFRILLAFFLVIFLRGKTGPSMVARVLKASSPSLMAFLFFLPPTLILGNPRLLLREVVPATTAMVLMVRRGCLSAPAKALIKSAVSWSDAMVGMSLN